MVKSKDQLQTIDRIFLGNGLKTPTCLVKFQTQIVNVINPQENMTRPDFYQHFIEIELN